ncbi:hypothetical protein MTO96_036641 [Rhipicephalus appendiculatus]
MTSQVGTPGHKHQLACTSMPDCKRQEITESEDDSTDIGDHNAANSTDLDMDEGGFRVVRHRKDRTVGIPVILAPASEGANLRQVNPIALYSEIEAILGGAPVKSHFTAQGSLLLDIATEDQANVLLETKNICGIAISARVPHSYMKNTCVVRGVPKMVLGRRVAYLPETSGSIPRKKNRPSGPNLVLRLGIQAYWLCGAHIRSQFGTPREDQPWLHQT